MNESTYRRCIKCGHQWTRREGKPEPKRCPRAKCRSLLWNQCELPAKLKEPDSITVREAKERELAPIEDL